MKHSPYNLSLNRSLEKRIVLEVLLQRFDYLLPVVLGDLAVDGNDDLQLAFIVHFIAFSTGGEIATPPPEGDERILRLVTGYMSCALNGKNENWK